jgi:hypothetical protein
MALDCSLAALAEFFADLSCSFWTLRWAFMSDFVMGWPPVGVMVEVVVAGVVVVVVVCRAQSGRESDTAKAAQRVNVLVVCIPDRMPGAG